MRLQDLIIEFLRENGLILTEGYVDDRPCKLIRFVRGNNKYSLVFSNNNPTIHLFKEKLWIKKPYSKIATTHGGPKKRSFNNKYHKIVIDLNNNDSLKQIVNFL